jgi:hypothetical protein
VVIHQPVEKVTYPLGAKIKPKFSQQPFLHPRKRSHTT